MQSVLDQTPVVLFATNREGTVTLCQGNALVDACFVCTCTPMLDGETVSGVNGIAIDVTHRYAAEREVRKLAQPNRMLIDNANDVVIAYDTTGRSTFVNQRRESLSGYSIEDGLQMSIADALHPEDRDSVLAIKADNACLLAIGAGDWTWQRDGETGFKGRRTARLVANQPVEDHVDRRAACSRQPAHTR